MDASPSADGWSIEARAALLLQLRHVGVRDIAVMRAFETTPREVFTPFRFRDLAARNIALPIGCGQTMPAPAELARRIEALGVEPHHRVLEVGAGSGFSAGVLARLAREVVTVERFETLAIEARRRLAALGIETVEVLIGDGVAEPPPGPFDRILLHMSFRALPQSALDRLAPVGVAILGRIEPGPEGARPVERLHRLRRENSALWAESDLGACRLGAALESVAHAL
jgi:protein-L-isoaspartate(D-aspartate) O-methyltransferase